jgi:hypothetical protein
MPPVRAVPATVLAIALAGCGARLGDPPGGGDIDAAGGGDDAPPPDAEVNAPPDARACVEGDARVSDPATGTCYAYFGTLTSWSNASVACTALGGHLATSTSAAENALILPLPTDLLNSPDVWLGGSDQISEMTWLWVTSEPFVFDNWRAGEPNDGNSPDVAEDCMVLEADMSGTWDDRPCGRLLPYICELP